MADIHPFLAPDLDAADALTAAQMAELAGVTLATFGQMRAPSRAGAYSCPVPAPDFHEGASPRWYRDTAARWTACRAAHLVPAPVVDAPPIGERPTVPVGYAGIATRLGVKPATVKQWRKRGLLPPARWTVGGAGAWDLYDQIIPWAEATGRAVVRERS
jgi:hypothetical protein